jgi:uncharacterized membrane protein
MQAAFWSTIAPAMATAFFASFVECVEAFTIILAVAVVDGWRPALAGAVAGLVLLAASVTVLGPILSYMPLHALQLTIGLLLLLFGARWQRKAILRAAGAMPLRDERAFYEAETALLAKRQRTAFVTGSVVAFKAVMLEGLEVVFVVIAVGAGRGLLWPAGVGALAACLLVFAMGLILHRPLSKIPENSLKHGVGILLSAFGLFWIGEGLGITWTGGDAAILAIAGLLLLLSATMVRIKARKLGRTAP